MAVIVVVESQISLLGYFFGFLLFFLDFQIEIVLSIIFQFEISQIKKDEINIINVFFTSNKTKVQLIVNLIKYLIIMKPNTWISFMFILNKFNFFS